jgi:hypothetical protein
MPMQQSIENVRYFNEENSHNEKPELHHEDVLHATQLKDTVFTYGYINMLLPYGKNFVVLTGVDVYNLYKTLVYESELKPHFGIIEN